MENNDDWKDWIYDILGDMDIVTCLYSGMFVDSGHTYHFDHWYDQQFYIDRYAGTSTDHHVE